VVRALSTSEALASELATSSLGALEIELVLLRRGDLISSGKD